MRFGAVFKYLLILVFPCPLPIGSERFQRLLIKCRYCFCEMPFCYLWIILPKSFGSLDKLLPFVNRILLCFLHFGDSIDSMFHSLFSETTSSFLIRIIRLSFFLIFVYTRLFFFCLILLFRIVPYMFFVLVLSICAMCGRSHHHIIIIVNFDFRFFF